MSIAWGSLVLLVLLLPGVLFFLGVYWPEQFTRESEPRSPLGQLAGALLIAFVVHGAAYLLISSLCGGWLPCISIKGLFDTLSAESQGPTGMATSRMFRDFRGWIFLYVLATSFAGMGLGALYGWLVSSRRVRGFSRHHWIYDLSVDGLTYAYVMTHVRQDDLVLMYKGFLRAFGLQQDGRFSYIVLTDVTRMYLKLSLTGSETSGADIQKVIGGTTPAEIVGPDTSKPKVRVQSLFVIEGEDIANAVFDILQTRATALERNALEKLVREEAHQMGLVLTQEQIDQILGPPD